MNESTYVLIDLLILLIQRTKWIVHLTFSASLTMAAAREQIPVIIKGPVPIKCFDTLNPEKPRRVGCSIIDVSFKEPVQFAELVFTNFYTASVFIYLKRLCPQQSRNNGSSAKARDNAGAGPSLESFSTRSQSLDLPDDERERPNLNQRKAPNATFKRRQEPPPETTRPWEFCLYRQLMSCPHFEFGSQDTFSILATDSAIDWRDALALRLILHQPSVPLVWRQFTLQDIKVFRNVMQKGPVLVAEDAFVQAKMRFATLKKNTKGMLVGLTVEPHPEKQDETK